MVRHCAMCLKQINDTVMTCGACKRRCYCSRTCQAADWKPNGTGQGHKNWCQLYCCEEGIDWDVLPVPGKGLGLIALKFIPSKSRIIVDAIRDINHPALQDLEPKGGNTQEKRALNVLGGENSSRSLLCLRIARANHDCNFNASHRHEEDMTVTILFSERDIEAGEEISIEYTASSDPSKGTSPDVSRLILLRKWGLTCPDDCVCKDLGRNQLVKKAMDLDARINLAATFDPTQALRMVEALLVIHEQINSSWISKERAYYDGFQIAILKRRTLKKAKVYIQHAYDIHATIISPLSSEAKRYKSYIDHPELHRNYLLLEH